MTQYIFDAALQLQDDAAAITSSDAGQVGAADVIRDLGGSTVRGDMVVDLNSIVINDNDETYVICLEGSTSSTFASGIQELATLRVGPLEVLSDDVDVDSIVGRYVVPFITTRVGTTYRFVRAYFNIGGSSPSLDAEVYLTIGA